MSAGQKAGRELDALVAEKVMGWLWLERAGHRWFGPSSEVGKTDPLYGTTRAADLTRDDLVVEDAWWLRDATQHADAPVVPHYSTAIADAWLVVEQMRADDYGFDLSSIEFDASWSVLFDSQLTAYSLTARRASTPALAICLAALACADAAQPASSEGVAHESRKKVSR